MTELDSLCTVLPQFILRTTSEDLFFIPDDCNLDLLSFNIMQDCAVHSAGLQQISKVLIYYVKSDRLCFVVGRTHLCALMAPVKPGLVQGQNIVQA